MSWPLDLWDHKFAATILARMLSGLLMVAYACVCKGRKHVVFIVEAAKRIYKVFIIQTDTEYRSSYVVQIQLETIVILEFKSSYLQT